MLLSSYEDFLLESKFNSLLEEILLLINENQGEWIDDKTVVWDLSKKKKKKIKDILQQTSKEGVKKMFNNFINAITNLPKKIKRGMLMSVVGIFLSYISYSELTSDLSPNQHQIMDLFDFKPQLKNKVTKKVIPANFQEAQKVVKLGEGGYTDDPQDKGNWVDGNLVGTNHGISAPTLKTVLGKIPSKSDMESLKYSEAVKIYKDRYWNRYNLSSLNNQGIANIIYDGIVNQGRGGMRSILKKTFDDLGIKKSSKIYSDKNWEKINKLNPEAVFNTIKKYRLKRYQKSKKYDIYGNGWEKRLNSIQFIPTKFNI